MELEHENSLIDRTQMILDKLMKAQGLDPMSSLHSSPSQSQNAYSFLSQLQYWNDYHLIESTTDPQQQQGHETTETVSLRECGTAPMYLTISLHDDSFVVFGGMQIDFAFKRKEDTPLRRQLRKHSRVEFFKKEGLLVFHVEQSLPTIKDLTPLIQRAQSLNDQTYHRLSLAMMEYQKRIPIQAEANRRYSQEIFTNNLQESYEMNYKKFEGWALQEIRKLKSTDFFAFSISKLNLETSEYEVKLSGQSQGLMALRGIDISDTSFFTQRKENYHYLDGESNMKFLHSQLTGMPCRSLETVLPMKIITFDELKIEVIHACHIQTNRDSKYPYIDQQLPMTHLKYEFAIGIALYSIPAEILKQVINLREQRTPADYMVLQDYQYSLESQLFFEKYYANEIGSKNNGKNKKNQQQKRGDALPNKGETADVLLQLFSSTTSSTS